MKILVIEDDVAISELICMNLEAAGYEVHAIYDGLGHRPLSAVSSRMTLRLWT